jgi:glycosyltransferase involved in cell wall biosynthesis
MRILIVARSLPFHRTGGMEVVAWDLACALRDAGHVVTILTTGLDKATVDLGYQVHGLSIVALNTTAGEYSAAWWKLSARYAEMNCRDIDVVLGVSAAANAMVVSDDNALRPIYVFQAHGTSWGEFVSKWRQRSIKSWVGSVRNVYWGFFKDWIYRRYDGVVAIGDLVDKQLRVPPGSWLRGNTPLRLISNGIPDHLFLFDKSRRHSMRTALGLGEENQLLLSLCRLHPQKGVMIGLEAFAQAAKLDPRLYYAIVGDGPQYDELVSRTKSLGMSERVHFAGRVERQNVPDWYLAADLFLFPTQRVEGLPINLLEALASGLPVIASHGGADSALPLDFVPMHDVAAFCDAILRNLPDQKLIQDTRSSRLPDCYCISTSSKNYVDFFEELLARRLDLKS